MSFFSSIDQTWHLSSLVFLGEVGEDRRREGEREKGKEREKERKRKSKKQTCKKSTANIFHLVKSHTHPPSPSLYPYSSPLLSSLQTSHSKEASSEKK